MTENKYHTSVIYINFSNDKTNTNIYVGSTYNYTNRKRSPKSDCNNVKSRKHNLKVYTHIRANKIGL